MSRNDERVDMQFDTKIAVVVRTDLEPWQKLNVAAFLSGGIAATFPECIGAPYEDGNGTKYLSLIGQPILIYGADRAALSHVDLRRDCNETCGCFNKFGVVLAKARTHNHRTESWREVPTPRLRNH